MISGIAFNTWWFILGAIAGFLFATVEIDYEEDDDDDISEEEKKHKNP